VYDATDLVLAVRLEKALAAHPMIAAHVRTVQAFDG